MDNNISFRGRRGTLHADCEKMGWDCYMQKPNVNQPKPSSHDTNSSKMSHSILKASVKNASFTFITQIVCRIVTFVLNVFLIRYVDGAVLGVINVRLVLLESTILSLLREPFLKACLTDTAKHNWAQVVNILWLAVFLCIGMSFPLGVAWLFLPTTDSLPPYYTFAVWSVVLSCTIQQSSLVVQLAASAFHFVGIKAILDGIMILIRTFVPLIFYDPKNALFAFGITQLVTAVFYTTSYYAYFYYHIEKLNKCSQKRKLSLKDSSDEYVIREFPFRTIKDFLPGQLENDDSYLDRKLSVLTCSFFGQGILKYIQTEGEKWIMTATSALTLTEQGIYETINNIGSLPARFIFRPIEDSGYFYFAQMVKRDKKISDQNSIMMQESVNVLIHLCSVVTCIGLVVLVFGLSYSDMLLSLLYGGSILISPLAVWLLKAHCCAMLLLGINGVTECYMHATANLNNWSAIINNWWIMVLQQIVFLIALYLFLTYFGPVGLILGNCLSMSLRIIYSTIFINARYQDTVYRPLYGLVPKPMFSMCLIATIVATLSHSYFFPADKISYLLIGIIMFIIVLRSLIYDYNELIKFVMSFIIKKDMKSLKPLLTRLGNLSRNGCLRILNWFKFPLK